MTTPTGLLPSELFKVGGAHFAVIDFIAELLIHNLPSNFHQYTAADLKNLSIEVNFKRLSRDLLSIFGKDSQGALGLSFESDNFISGFFDVEWMHEVNIETFKQGEFYVVETGEPQVYQTVMYSRAEVEGWVSICLEMAFSHLPPLKKDLEKMQREYYDCNCAKSLLMNKLKGNLDWDAGPCGVLSAYDIGRWSAVEYTLLNAVQSFYIR